LNHLFSGYPSLLTGCCRCRDYCIVVADIVYPLYCVYCIYCTRCITRFFSPPIVYQLSFVLLLSTHILYIYISLFPFCTVTSQCSLNSYLCAYELVIDVPHPFIRRFMLLCTLYSDYTGGSLSYRLPFQLFLFCCYNFFPPLLLVSLKGELQRLLIGIFHMLVFDLDVCDTEIHMKPCLLTLTMRELPWLSSPPLLFY
jgi:hypothetical protein